MLPDAWLLRIGMLMIVATGVIQVVAQLVLSHMMDVLPSPSLSRHPRYYMLTHSVTAVVILMIGHILQVTMWAALSLSLGRIRGLQQRSLLLAGELHHPGRQRPRAAAQPPHDRRTGSGGRHADVRLVDRAAGGGGAAHRPPSANLTGRKPGMSDCRRRRAPDRPIRPRVRRVRCEPTSPQRVPRGDWAFRAARHGPPGRAQRRSRADSSPGCPRHRDSPP